MRPDELPRIPGYTGISWLGAGGAADVYRAKREHLGRWVAIKVFRMALPGQQAVEQFRAECDAVIRLDREPDVIVVHDAGILPDGRPYLVSELCDGSLQQLVARRGALPPGEVSEIGHRIATALVAAHFARVLHGDVTPQNVLIRPSGAPVLADFGLAVLRDHRGNTSVGFTPGHAAPETVRHDGALDERSDVYGLGSTLYTALTGHPPFSVRPGEAEVARLRRILHDPPARPTVGPDRLADLLLAMLAKDPSARPSAAEVAGALSAAPSPAAPPPAAPSPAAPSPAAPSPAAPSSAVPSPAVPSPAGPASAAQAMSDGPTIGPRYAPPAGFAPASQARTQLRAAAAAAAVAAAADRHPAPGTVAGRGWLVAALVVVAGLGFTTAMGLTAALWPWLPPAPDVVPAAPPFRIELATPEDAGTSVTLRWSADHRNVDFAVVIAEMGVSKSRVELVNRDTTATVSVTPGVQYCFSIQGTDGRNPPVQSEPEGIRGALCRDSPF